MKNNILVSALFAIIFILVAILVFQGVHGCTANNVSALDTLSNKAHSEQTVMKDTILKYDTIKQKADVIYRTKHDTLWAESSNAVDSDFNVVFPRDTADTTTYIAGYTQLRKAIDANNRSLRDSIKNSASVAQVSTCTTTVTKIVNQIDTVKDSIKLKNKSTNWTAVGITGAIIVILSFFAGHSLN